MSEWLDIMLGEIERRRQEARDAEAEAARRREPADDPPGDAQEK